MIEKLTKWRKPECSAAEIFAEKLNEVIDWINDEPKRKLSVARPNPLLNDIKPTKKLDIEHVSNLLKIGANTKVIKLINESFEDPNSLFELPSQEKLSKLKQELKPEYIGDQWAMCPDCGKVIYSSHSLEIHHSQCDLNKESGIKSKSNLNVSKELDNLKWKVGDEAWFVNTIDYGFSNGWKTESLILHNEDIDEIDKGDMNIFKTKAQAEAALAEIKQVMEKYQ